MRIDELKKLPTHRLQAYYEKHLHVNRLPNQTETEHYCEGNDCLTCEQINDFFNLAYAVRDELRTRTNHRRLKKRFRKNYECGH